MWERRGESTRALVVVIEERLGSGPSAARAASLAGVEREREVQAALQAAGGERLGAPGGVVVARFEHAAPALSAALALARDFARRAVRGAKPVLPRIAVAAARSDTDLERALGLGAAARPGEVLLAWPPRQGLARALPPGARLRRVRRAVESALGPDSRLYCVVVDASSARPGRAVAAGRLDRLPAPVTHFIGRERELADAAALLAQTRLLTLTGAGGVGKTRFALQLAWEVRERFEHGALFVDLAPISDPRLVVPTIAHALGVPDVHGRSPLENVAAFLRERRLLLLLDNFERVVEAGPHLLELLHTCPSLALLVTSRVALRVSAEQEFAIPPLSLADPDRLARGGLEALRTARESEAVRLFAERARAVQPDFRLSEDNAAAVAQLCRMLDGLPLAIELAAARVRLFPPAAMLARLIAGQAAEGSAGRRLDFLGDGPRDLPARQRTLRATLDWSYDLLTPDEQALLRRLSVFVGGCALEAVEAIGRAEIGDGRWTFTEDEALKGLEALIAKSLLWCRDTSGGPRYVFLETVREYGIDQLARAGELRTARRWHAGYFLDLAERAEHGLRGPEQRRWLDLLQAEHDNLRAALEWSLSEGGDPAVGLRLAGALGWFWGARGHASEGRSWLARALGREVADRAGRTKALQSAGWLAHIQRDSDAAREALQRALDLARAQGDRAAEAWTLHLLGRVAYFRGEAETARALGSRSLELARAAGDRWLEAWALHLLGLARHIADDYRAARDCYARALALRRELGHLEGIAICQNLTAMVAYRQGHLAEAVALTRDALLTLHGLGSYWTVHNALATLATLAVAVGQAQRGVRLAGAIEVVSESVDVTPIPLAERMLANALREARRALGEEAYAAAWAAGRSLSLEQAVSDALAVQPAAGRGGSGSKARPGRLSAREIEVLRLIAGGKTTREIATELSVSVPTVERHITHIYSKIGARGRADATAFALKHDLA